MAAPVTFLAGRAGSGKSRFIRQRVAELCARGETVALIVPEQCTSVSYTHLDVYKRQVLD